MLQLESVVNMGLVWNILNNYKQWINVPYNKIYIFPSVFLMNRYYTYPVNHLQSIVADINGECEAQTTMKPENETTAA